MKKFGIVILGFIIILFGLLTYTHFAKLRGQASYNYKLIKSDQPAGSYKSSILGTSFNYQPSWGKVLIDNNSAMKSDKYEYVYFENNKNLFTTIGDGGRGNIVDGIDIKLNQEIKVTSLDGHRARINIYRDPDSKYWIEAFVLDKKDKSKEVLYIKYFGALTKEELGTYKSDFTNLLTSFSQ